MIGSWFIAEILTFSFCSCIFFPQTLVWVMAGTSREIRCYPFHEISRKPPQPLRDRLLRFHTMTQWKTFAGHPHLHHGVGRNGS